MKSSLASLIAIIITVASPAFAQQPLSPEERLARLEQQAAALLAEIQQFRKEMKPAGGTRGAAESPAAPEMQPGVLAKIYVRTGGADQYSPPPDKATPSDSRLHSDSKFNALLQSKAAGYLNQAVTVVWEGFYKVEESGVYEFMLESKSATVQLGPKSLNARAEKAVRLELQPGFWPILVRDGVQPGRGGIDVNLRVKRSGFDPVSISPGSLWTPKLD